MHRSRNRIVPAALAATALAALVGRAESPVTLQAMTLAAVEDPEASDFDADLRKVEAVFFQGLVKARGQKRDA